MSKKIPKLNERGILIPPEKLLENAKALLESKNANFLRPAILESITALEVFVQKLIIDELEKIFSKNVKKGIENKTRFSFDDRLDWVLEIVAGKTLKDEKKLWSKMKEVRTIRNKVVHKGITIKRKDAEKTYRLVNSILGFLLAEIEIPRFLEEYKKLIKRRVRRKEKITERSLGLFLRKKLQEFAVGKLTIERGIKGIRPDILYKAGDYSFVVELKIVKEIQGGADLMAMVKNIERVFKSLNLDKIFIIAIMPKGSESTLLTGSKKIKLLTVDVLPQK